jgi:phospholipase/carboxylesterase
MANLDGPRWGPASGGKPHHLIVLCHGVGADGHDVIDLAPAWGPAVPDAAFVAPHAPDAYDLDLSSPGRQWFTIADRSPPVREAGVRRAAAALDPFVDAELVRLGLPGDAYALMGFSQGAMTALFAGLRRTPAPRGILAFSGALIAPESLARELANRAPVLIVHGETDDVVPVDRSREAEVVLRDAGLPVEASYIPGLGHGIDEAGIRLGALFLQRFMTD